VTVGWSFGQAQDGVQITGGRSGPTTKGADMQATADTTTRFDIAALLLRAAIAAIFITHGAQKLFGVFGGGGLDATAQGMAGNGLKPGMFFAVLAGVTELGGGLLLLVGLLTPLAGLALAAVMVMAIITVTWPLGFVGARGAGYEYNLLLTVVALALAVAGPGRLSLDHRLGLDGSAGERIRRIRQLVSR